MDGKLMLDCLVILISALAAVIPTSRMLFKDQGPEEVILPRAFLRTGGAS